MTTMTHTDTEINERQTSAFDYVVEQVPLTTPDGGKTRFFGNRRVDTGEVLGVVTEQYEVLQNTNLFAAVEDVFAANSFGNFKRRTVVTHGGAKVRAIYDFNSHGIKLANGNDLILRLKVQNSFDGSMRAALQVGLFRLICSNGLAAPMGAVGMTRKHTQGLDPEMVEKAFARSVTAFSESAPLFNAMIAMNVGQAGGNRILEGFEKSKVISNRMREGIQQVWNAPTYKEDNDRNLFNLYNAVTQHLTHSVETKRFDLAERVNTSILGAFTRAAKRGGIDELLAVGNQSPDLN